MVTEEFNPGEGPFLKSPAMSPESRPAMPLTIDLKSLAVNALSVVQAPALDALRNVEGPTQKRVSSRNGGHSTGLHQQQHRPGPLPHQREIMSQAPNPVLAPPIFSYTCSAAQGTYFPRQSSSQVLWHPIDAKSPITRSPTTDMCGGLPPIGSPHYESNGQFFLPPIRSQLGEQLSDCPKMKEKEHATRHPRPTRPSFIASPPGASHMPPTSNSGQQQQIPTPASSTTDRRSIGNVTSPKTGKFVCKSSGCSAAPFQTKYLLNSHANVHSSLRPHYCAVRGCPRSEGGKGFKRKSELTRHGLVHEPPGYICPFCPDREHKYPRPDNVQR